MLGAVLFGCFLEISQVVGFLVGLCGWLQAWVIWVCVFATYGYLWAFYLCIVVQVRF